jgi:hypothetical protein
LGSIKISLFRTRQQEQPRKGPAGDGGPAVADAEANPASSSSQAGDNNNNNKKVVEEELVGVVSISAKAFLEPLMYSRSACVIHERGTLVGGALCGGAEAKVQLQLNPEELISSFMDME